MCGSYTIAPYKVLQSAVDCDTLLLPVRVRDVDNARTWSPTRLYTLSKLLHLPTLRACFMAIHTCSGKIRFSDSQQFTL